MARRVALLVLAAATMAMSCADPADEPRSMPDDPETTWTLADVVVVALDDRVVDVTAAAVTIDDQSTLEVTGAVVRILEAGSIVEVQLRLGGRCGEPTPISIETTGASMKIRIGVVADASGCEAAEFDTAFDIRVADGAAVDAVTVVDAAR